MLSSSVQTSYTGFPLYDHCAVTEKIVLTLNCPYSEFHCSQDAVLGSPLLCPYIKTFETVVVKRNCYTLQAQSHFEAALKRYHEEHKDVEELLQIRDQAYSDLLGTSDAPAVSPQPFFQGLSQKAGMHGLLIQ